MSLQEGSLQIYMPQTLNSIEKSNLCDDFAVQKRV